jgi:hypothetical protein
LPQGEGPDKSVVIVQAVSTTTRVDQPDSVGGVPQTQSPNKSRSHQCLVKAGGNLALHAGVDALGFIPGVGGAAVATFSGYAVALIDSTTPEGVTASVGLNALGTGFLVAKANEGSIAKFSARLAEGIPGIGTVITLGSLVLDGYNAVKQYQACTAGGN